MSQPAGDKPSLKGAWSGSSNQFSNFTPHEISSEWLSYRLQLLCTVWPREVLTFRWENSPLSGRGQGQVANFRILHPLKISLERLKLQSSNFVWCRLYRVLAFGRPTISKKGVARVTWFISKFCTSLNISEMAEDRIVKFFARFDAISISLVIMTNCPPVGRG